MCQGRSESGFDADSHNTDDPLAPGAAFPSDRAVLLHPPDDVLHPVTWDIELPADGGYGYPGVLAHEVDHTVTAI